jgi:methylated-DNA-[protein]-cysteine S-methyltransferase
MCLAASPQGLAGAWFIDQQHLPSHLDGPTAWPRGDNHPVLREAREQLEAYFGGQRKIFDLPLDIHGGTLFQQSVWRALSTIPFGARHSYADISRLIGNPKAVRAVGAAVGRNPISLIVPCHRVLGSDGSLTGYAGGLDRKTALLALEGVALPPPTPPLRQSRLTSQTSPHQATLL